MGVGSRDSDDQSLASLLINPTPSSKRARVQVLRETELVARSQVAPEKKEMTMSCQ